jgi:hypothetical protein
MAIEIEMTGSGTVGDILPGWTVNEYATPANIGDFSNGSGGVNFTAEAKNDSLLLANNNIITKYTDPARSLGQVSGVVKTVSQSGMTVSVVHYNKFAKFDADYNIPYLNVGNLWNAVDLLTQLTGTIRIGIASFEELI